MSDSWRPHRRQTRLLCPWDSPGKNTGVGRHFLLQCMKVKGDSEVGQSCPALSDPMDCSSSIPGISQARVLEWVASGFTDTKVLLQTYCCCLVTKWSEVKWKLLSCVWLLILQVRILEGVAFPFSRGSSQPRDQTQVFHIAGTFFTSWATRDVQEHRSE